MVWSKNFVRSIEGKAIWNWWKKIKSTIPGEQNYSVWLWSKMAKQFSVNSHIIFFFVVNNKQVSQHSASCFPFSDFRYFQPFNLLNGKRSMSSESLTVICENCRAKLQSLIRINHVIVKDLINIWPRW